MFNNSNNDEKVVFVSGEIKTTQNGSFYVWSKTIDLEEIAKELGTTVVNAVVTKPRKPKSEAERLIIFKAGDRKYLSKNKGNGTSRQKHDEQPVLI